MGWSLYGRSWTSLPTHFISAPWLSEHTICHDAHSTECEIPAHALSKVSKNLKVMATDWIKTCWLKFMVHWIVVIAVLSTITCNGVSIDWCMGPFIKCPCNYIVHVNQTQSSIYLMNIVWLPICYEMGSTKFSSTCYS